MSDKRASGHKPDPVASNSRGPVAALVAVAILAGLLYWGFQAIIHHNAMQNCLDSGRRDCETRVSP